MQIFNILAYNSGLFEDLPATFGEIRQRLEQKDSIASWLNPTSCLSIAQQDDVLFLGELQIMQDILTKVHSLLFSLILFVFSPSFIYSWHLIRKMLLIKCRTVIILQLVALTCWLKNMVQAHARLMKVFKFWKDSLQR